MKKLPLYLMISALGLMLFWQTLTARAATSDDCHRVDVNAIQDLSSLSILWYCSMETTVYFGVCDSGGVAGDDRFNIMHDNRVVAYNTFEDNLEFGHIGQVQISPGFHTSVLNSLSSTNSPPATYSYAISNDLSAVSSFLQSDCGSDFSQMHTSSSCEYGPRDVPIFTTDTAPVHGILEFRVVLGNESSREEGALYKTWQVERGERINHAVIPHVASPRWGRLWWQPQAEGEWYLLTSQYWSGDNTAASEYGIACHLGPQPSYHTAFSQTVPENKVCFDLVRGCRP